MALSGTQLQGLIGKGNNNSGGIDQAIQIWGLWQFAGTIGANDGLGTTVSVQMIGQDCGDFTVASDGSVTVPLFGFTLSGVAGVVTMANLLAADGLFDIESNCPISILNGGPRLFINVPVVIGRAYVSQGQRQRALVPGSIKSNQNGLGLTRRTNQYAVLVEDVVVASIGSSFTPAPTGDMISTIFTDPGTSLDPTKGFSGVWWDTFDSLGTTFDDQFCWQIDRPYPFLLAAVTQFMEVEER